MSETVTGARPRTGFSFHQVEGGGVLFDATEGRLYALNPAAGLTWLCITGRLSQNESMLALAKAFDVDRSYVREDHNGPDWFTPADANVSASRGESAS